MFYNILLMFVFIFVFYFVILHFFYYYFVCGFSFCAASFRFLYKSTDHCNRV